MTEPRAAARRLNHKPRSLMNTTNLPAIAPTDLPPFTGALSSHRGRRLLPLAGLLAFLLSVWVLDRELRVLDYRAIVASLRASSWTVLALCLLLTALDYVALTCYDMLAFRYIGRTLSRWRIAVASFVGYAVANTTGFAVVSGSLLRYRFYSRWGISAGELARIVFFCSSTFWIGLLLLGGVALTLAPTAVESRLPIGAGLRVLGVGALGVVAVYVLTSVTRRSPIRVRGIEVSLPSPSLVAGQIALSVTDWVLAVGALYVLLPGPRPDFLLVAQAVVIAQVVGLVSHVPGGLGVFESAVVLLLAPVLPAAEVIPALVLFRAIYYLAPFAAAVGVLLIDQAWERRHDVDEWGGAIGSLATATVPKLLAGLTFVAGAVLLGSGATPTLPSRLAWLARVLPLPVIEISHLAGSLVGVALLLLSHGISRRLDAAFFLAVLALGTGIVASLLRGGEIGVAIILGSLLGGLLVARSSFDRKTSLFAARFSPDWVVAVVAVVATSIWLGTLAFRHVEYQDALWWRFAAAQEAPRYLRMTVVLAVSVVVVGVVRLFRPAPPPLVRPSDADIAGAALVIDAQESTAAQLVYLRDKSILWNETRTSFIMYGVKRQTWVALGDPVGPDHESPALLRAFLERCDDFDATPVFYEIGREDLYQYADLGLAFIKIGEEGHVSLPGFSLEGGQAKDFRSALRKMDQAGCAFRVVPAEETPALMPVLEEVSDEWLAEKAAGEKGFSLGFFSPEYLGRFPVGVIERGDQVEAFVSILPGPRRIELSIDLMRYRGSAPPRTMDALLVSVMQWGQRERYQRFMLGMSPLGGLEVSATSPLWTRFGAFAYRYGETFYNFQGLRAYKEKFDPVWTPRYLAYPGGLSLPGVLADVAGLVSGGYGKIFKR